MSYIYKITSAEKAHHIAGDADYLDVAYEVYDDGGKFVSDYREGFPIGTTEDQIRQALQKKANRCETDALKRIADAEQVKADEKTNALLGKLAADAPKKEKGQK